MKTEKHFTASVYILKEESVLLLMHPKFKKWLPPGGHIEPNETPIEAARREIMEETGLEIEFFSDEHLQINRPNAQSFYRPFLCLLEEVPPFKDQPAHQHIDLIYLAVPLSLESPLVSPFPIRWFTFDEVEKLEGDVAIFEETKQVIASIRSTTKKGQCRK